MAKANFDLPEDKLKQVMELAQAKTKKEALIIAMDSYLRKKQIEKLIASYGKVSLRWTLKSLRKFRA